MEKPMNEEMVNKGLQAIESCGEYFDEFAKEHGKSGFVWLSQDETGELVVYTRGEYRNQILQFLETLK